MASNPVIEPISGVNVDVEAEAKQRTPYADENAFTAVDNKVHAWQKPGAWGTTLRVLRKIEGVVWDDPDKPAAEKKFLRKLDFFILTSTCLGYFCKNLDQANLNNAYVSGMKEAIGMVGNDLTYAGNVFTAGYAFGQIPLIILITRVRPSYVVPVFELLWGVTTFCSSAITNVSQLYALRFLLGLFEAAYFPVIIYVIGSWYTARERAKRVVLFYSTATFATMFSGYLQAGAYDNLSGVLGRAGWQWLYIICGVITLPSAFLVFFFLPDFPENTKAFYLTKEEAAWARERLLRQGYVPLGANPWNKTKIFKIIKRWQFYALSIGYFFVQGGLPGYQPVFSLWLKTQGYSVYSINVLPTATYGIAAGVQIIVAMLSDSVLKGRRVEAIAFLQSVTIFSCICLAVWDIPRGLQFAAYYLSYFSAGIPGIYFSWFADLIPDDHEMRGFMIAFSNIFSYVNVIWFTDVFWGTSDSPQFHKGFIASACWGSALIVLSIFLQYMQNRMTQSSRKTIESDVIQQEVFTQPKDV